MVMTLIAVLKERVRGDGGLLRRIERNNACRRIERIDDEKAPT